MTRIILTIIFTAVSAASVAAQDQWKNVYTESAWASRDLWQRAGELIKNLNIKAGCSVADIGCHEGYMTFKLSREIGRDGKVYAVDLDAARLAKLKMHRDMERISNITAIQGAVDNPKLLTDQLDAVLILDTYHEMRDHDKILQHVKKSLRAGGRLVICEAIADQRRKSLRTDQEAKHEIGMNFVREDLENMGFKILDTKDPFVDRTIEKGDKMWLIVATKK
jgi:ubiquinone/menaquinone biosynthesis C-methylase UbiE